MNQKEIRELIDFLIEKDIAEFELERGDVKVRIRRGAPAPIVTTAAPAQPAPLATATSETASVPVTQPPTAVARAAAEEEGLHIVRSPIVGTFYEAPAPGALPFVKVADT